MNPAQLKAARLASGWTQHDAAERLGLSQPYFSQLERGTRPIPAELALAAFRELGLSPVSLPLPRLSTTLTPMDPDLIASHLATLGYPGFAHLPHTATSTNPAEVLVRAIVHKNLDVRIVEGLPWLIKTFIGMDWSWLTAQCRILNLQNRLGYLGTLASHIATPLSKEFILQSLAHLEASRLVAEGTLCRDSMTQPERVWIGKHRPPEAVHWALLTTLTANQLTHASE